MLDDGKGSKKLAYKVGDQIKVAKGKSWVDANASERALIDPKESNLDKDMIAKINLGTSGNAGFKSLSSVRQAAVMNEIIIPDYVNKGKEVHVLGNKFIMKAENGEPLAFRRTNSKIEPHEHGASNSSGTARHSYGDFYAIPQSSSDYAQAKVLLQ